MKFVGGSLIPGEQYYTGIILPHRQFYTGIILPGGRTIPGAVLFLYTGMLKCKVFIVYLTCLVTEQKSSPAPAMVTTDG